MPETKPQHLRVLIANENRDLAQVVVGLGHDVIAREIYVKEVGAVTAREHPYVALVGLGESSAHDERVPAGNADTARGEKSGPAAADRRFQSLGGAS